MNRNRNIKAAAVALTAGVIIGSANVPVAANGSLAGAVASMYSVNEAVIDEVSALSGTNLAIAKILKGEMEGESTAASDTSSETEESSSSGEFDNIGIAEVEGYLNVRSEPSEESEVVGKLYSHGAATIIDDAEEAEEAVQAEGDWVHVTSGNVDGYVMEEFLVIGDRDLCIAHSRIMARSKVDGLNVRSDSNTDSSIVDRKTVGDGLPVVDLMTDDEEWIETTEGFVSTDYVDISREYNSIAESKAEEEARLAAERAAREAAERAARAEAEAAAQAAAAQAANNNGGGAGARQQAPAKSGQAAPAAPKAAKTYNAPSGGNGAAVAEYGKQFVGNPYVYGGTSLTNGTDCSGFVMSVYRQFGVSLPHSSSAQRSVGTSVPVSDMQAGDIVCYNGHVGIAIGGGQIVHASNARDGIKISTAYYRDILSVRRLL